MNDISALINSVNAGEPGAQDRLFAAAYGESWLGRVCAAAAATRC